MAQERRQCKYKTLGMWSASCLCRIGEKTHENPECQANDSLERGATCGAGILSEGENEPCIEIDVAWLLHVCISHTTRRLMRGVNVTTQTRKTLKYDCSFGKLIFGASFLFCPFFFLQFSFLWSLHAPNGVSRHQFRLTAMLNNIGELPLKIHEKRRHRKYRRSENMKWNYSK